MFNSQSSSSQSSGGGGVSDEGTFIDLASSSQSSTSSSSSSVNSASAGGTSSSSSNTTVDGDSPANTSSSSSSVLSGEMNESTDALFYRINKQGGGDVDMNGSVDAYYHSQTVTTNNKFQHMKNIINTPNSSSANNSSIEDTSITVSPPHKLSSSSLRTDNTIFEFTSPSRPHFLSSVNKKHLLFQINHGDELMYVWHKPWRPSRDLPEATTTRHDNKRTKTSPPDETAPIQRNHIVVVDQAPFSVYKAVKSQESTDSSNLRVVNSNRNHPYNNSIRPSSNNITNQLTSPTSLPNEIANHHQSTADGPIMMVTNVTESFPESQQPMCQTYPRTSKTTTTSQSTGENNKSTSRNSSSNAILAQLKSIGPNFKSIFVRPKNSKHIDSSLIMNKKSTVKDDESNKSILNMLFSVNGSKQTGIGGAGSTTTSASGNVISSANSAIMRLLPNIEPKELKLNQSVDDLLKKFATENDVLSRTIKRINAEASVSSTRSMSPASTRSPSPVLFGQSGTSVHHHHHNTTPTTTTGTTGRHKSRLTTSSMNKWTCMVCLSKHAYQVEICPVCGSCKSSMSPPQEISPNSCSSSSSSFQPNGAANTTINFSKHYNSGQQAVSTTSSVSSYLLNDLGFKHKLKEGTEHARNQQQHQRDQSDTSSFSASSDSHNVTGSSSSSSRRDMKSTTFLSAAPANNPYLKKWTCLYCNYCNDSLKIVCLNCRQLKPNQSLASTSKSTLRLLEETSSSSSPATKSVSGLALNHDNTDNNNEIRNGESSNSDRTPSKKSKELDAGQVCSSCKSPLHEMSSATAASTSKQQQQPSLASQFAATSANKWTCSTCLVKNDETKEACVTCGTAKQQPATTKPSTSSITITNIQNNNNNNSAPLGSLWSSSDSKNKWTCSTCLIKNDNSKSACVSCMTPKPGDSSSQSTASSTTTTSLWSSAGNKDKWTCPTCLIKNDDAKDVCVSCMTSKPSTGVKSATTQPAASTQLSQPSNSLSSLAAGDKDKWTCSTCLIKNVDSASACVSCATPKPSGGGVNTKPFGTSLFGASLGGGGDKWTCSTCLIKNDSSKVKCDACQSDKPGGSATTKATLSTQSTLLLPNTTTSGVSFAPVNSSIKFGLGSNSIGTNNSFMSTTSTSGSSTASNPIKFDSSVFSAKSSFSIGSGGSFTGSTSSSTATTAAPSAGSLFNSWPKPSSDATPAATVTATPATSNPPPVISFGGQGKLDFSKPSTTSEQPKKDFFSSLSTSTSGTTPGSLFKLPTTTIGSSTTLNTPADSSQSTTTAAAPINFAGTAFKLDAPTTTTPALSLSSSSNQVKPFTNFFATTGSQQQQSSGGATSSEKPMTPFSSFAATTTASKETTPSQLVSSTSTTLLPGSLFGPTATTASVSNTSSQQQPPSSTATSPFFSFGSSSTGSTTTTAAAPSIFGTSSTTQPTTATTPATSSLFGNLTAAAPSTNTPQQQTTSTQPFGSQFSLFGPTNPATTSSTSSGSVSGFQFSFNKPPSSTGDSGGSLFGQAAPNQTVPAPTTTSQAPSSLFSNTGTNSSNQFGLMFGANTNASTAPVAPSSSNTTTAPSFSFNPAPTMNFNFGSTAAPLGLNQNGIIQFSGNTDTTTTPEGRKFRRAKRTYK